MTVIAICVLSCKKTKKNPKNNCFYSCVENTYMTTSFS